MIGRSIIEVDDINNEELMVILQTVSICVKSQWTVCMDS